MIGVSRKGVKRADGPALHPPTIGWKLSPSTGRIAKSLLDRSDHVIVVTPHRIPATVWTDVPGLKPLQPALKRLGQEGIGRPVRGSLAGTAGTGVTFGALPAHDDDDAPTTSFALLKFAGDLVADALADEPRSLVILVHGFSATEEPRVARALLLALGARSWQLPSFRKDPKATALRTVQLAGLRERLDTRRTLAEIEGANLVRWLTALPSNKLSATKYRALLAKLARQHGWEFEWLGESELRRRNAGAFLAVAQGNAQPDAGIACLRYRPRGTAAGRAKRNAAPDLALVGKGVIFDTGGTNLKTAPHMLDMHTDMSGSAVALGVLQSLTALGSKLSVDCWLAITENRTGPTAYKQRDVVTASNGTTIEVIHTDAEGRMVLADTLAIASAARPRVIVDYATLTGACVYALYERYSGVFTNRPAFNELLVRAGRDSGERVWPFPDDPDYDEDIKSKVADVAQCASGGEADHILAARFLRRFVPKETPWIHVDLASSLRKDGLAQMPGGPTGFGVRLTLSLLLDHAGEFNRLAN